MAALNENGLIEQIFAIKSEAEFDICALEVFRYQYKTNPVYREFTNALNIDINEISERSKIPYLPISFFKSHRIFCGEREQEMVFYSSGTTGEKTSAHHVARVEIYRQSFRKAFQYFYGDVSNYCILALLPSYKEREGSSLIFMVDDLIAKSAHAQSGYYLKADELLLDTLVSLDSSGVKTLMIGVSYALLDFAEKFQLNLKHGIVMETGGMKGRRKELVREELHQILKASFGVNAIHSEYGMTEMMSQGYSKGNGIFECPPWMRVEVREIDDPLSPALTQKTGGLNVIDLANLNSCSFISTQDLGKVYSNNTFEVLGRFDNSDIRGCNLLL